MNQNAPISFTLFRVLIIVLAALPLVVVVLALFGTGPAGDLLEDPLAVAEGWFSSQTGLAIP